MMDVKDKKILVLGLGVSGYAACKLLAERGALVRVSERADSSAVRERLEKLKDYSIEYETGGHTSRFCSNSEIVIASPGINTLLLCSSGILSEKALVLSELELGFLFCPAPIIAITGTNGKTTTTRLIGRILSAHGRHTVECGNIGNPLSGEVDFLTAESVAVVEVSSFQLENIRKFKPYIAVLLNVSEDHYDRHGNYENYKTKKFKIFENQSKKDWAILNSSFAGDGMTRKIKSRLLFYSRRDGDIVIDSGGKNECVIKENEITLKGAHNCDNAQSAAIAAHIMGVEKDIIRENIISFKGLEHRCESVAVFEGIEFIDDSKATNIDAARSALEGMREKVILIAGGRDKGGDYQSIIPIVKKRVKAMVLIGEAREKMARVFKDTVPVVYAESMAEAVKKSISLAEASGAVLLSPMCSSFDMFPDYKERGEIFQKEVKTRYCPFVKDKTQMDIRKNEQ